MSLLRASTVLGQHVEQSGALATQRLHAIQRSTDCLNLVSGNNKPSFETGLSRTLISIAKPTLASLESLRNHSALDGAFFALSDRANTGLEKLPQTSTNLDGAILCITLAGQYKDIIESRAQKRSRSLVLAMNETLQTCASALQDAITAGEVDALSRCTAAQKLLIGVQKAENQKLRERIRRLEHED